MATEFSEKKADKLLGRNEEKGDLPYVSNEKGVLDQDVDHVYDLSVTKDGVKVQPQPTADPLDPLNWPSFKKHTILGIVMYL